MHEGFLLGTGKDRMWGLTDVSYNACGRRAACRRIAKDLPVCGEAREVRD